MIETGVLPQSISAKGDRLRRDVISTGHAPATLDAACWSVATTSDFRSAVLKAANLGDDADTVGAVTGQLAGALYGLSGIPSGWLEKLAWRDDIIGRADKLWALRGL
jgi:ADP-ribosyl-[dinitrogen reductase] hydrolase